MAPLVVRPLDIDEPCLAPLGGTIKLPRSGRNSRRIFVTVFVTEQAEIEIALIHLIEIDLIGTTIRRGQLLEQEHLKEPAQQRVALDIGLKCLPFLGQLFLNAADENRVLCHATDGTYHCAEVQL